MTLETYPREEYEMFKASVEVSLLLQIHNLLEMRVIDVGIHTEQPLKDCLHHIFKVGRKG